MAGSNDLDTHHHAEPVAATSDIPSLPFTPIPRPALLYQLDEFASTGTGRVLLICSPVGSGKTVLLADWTARTARSLPGTPTMAWVTITEQRYTLDGLWADLRARLGLAPPVAAALRTPVARATELVADLERSGRRAVVVIDDAHLITDPMTLAGLEYFLRHLPSRVAVVLCARFDPPIRWHLLELESRLARWGAEELALSADDAARLCLEHGCELADAELATLMELTHGWAALIRIAAIYLAAHPGDYRTALAVLARMPNSISDLLAGELIDALAPALRQFLTQTSMPVEFTERMADELVGGGAAYWLHELERISYPLTAKVREGRVWYAYHPFLRGYFLAEVNRLGAGYHDDLRVRTAQSLLAAGESTQAWAQLTEVSEPRHLLEFLSAHGVSEVIAGGGPAVFDALRRAGSAVLDDPFLLLLRAIDALLSGDLAAAVAFREALGGRPGPSASLAEPEVVDALIDAVDAEIGVATADSATALVPPPPTPVQPPEVQCYLAIAAATVQIMGDNVAVGEERMRAALALAQSSGHPRLHLRAVTRLATASGRTGAITAMRRRAGRAIALAREYQLTHTPDAAHAVALEVFGAYLQGEVPESGLAIGLLTESAGIDGQTAPAGGLPAQIVGTLAAFDSAADRRPTADLLRSATIDMLGTHPSAAISGGLIPHVVWVLLHVQEPRTAHLLTEQARAVLGEIPETVVATAAVAVAAHRPKTVIGLVEPLLATSEPHPVQAVAAWLLCSCAHAELGNATKSIEALKSAVRIAAADQIARPFLDVPGVLKQLDEFAGSFGPDEDFVDFVRHNPAAARAHRHPALTETQQRILGQLPSGRTTQQIAADLGVSINTVKTHLRGIYAKLGVNSRTDVLAEARRSGLL